MAALYVFPNDARGIRSRVAIAQQQNSERRKFLLNSLNDINLDLNKTMDANTPSV